MARQSGKATTADRQAKPRKSGSSGSGGSGGSSSSGGAIKKLISLVLLLAMLGFVGLIIYRFFEDRMHKAAFDDGLPWPSLSEGTWLRECFTSELHENENVCRGSPEALWQVRLDAITGPDALVVSLAQRDGDRFSFDVSLAAPMAWPANTDALIGQDIILGGRVKTDVLLGHEIADGVVWGFPYRTALPRSAGVPVDFLIGDFWRTCARATPQAFAANCQGRRLLVDVIQNNRVDNRLDGDIPISVTPRPRVTLALNGRYIWKGSGIRVRGTRLRVIGTIDGLTRSGDGGMTLALGPASILTPVR